MGENLFVSTGPFNATKALMNCFWQSVKIHLRFCVKAICKVNRKALLDVFCVFFAAFTLKTNAAAQSFATQWA
ncbi:hypothetical protein DPX16_5975 [Anabarilius grahami]|uniref:Uncharacterized protein n=1 Tax=Anabarilius grahami TaxID=495550 RepID=A0A3N0Z2C8_ANAGA|nr:hypothetical protein DPX16_5975 [Anabarilius grahami]